MSDVITPLPIRRHAISALGPVRREKADLKQNLLDFLAVTGCLLKSASAEHISEPRHVESTSKAFLPLTPFVDASFHHRTVWPMPVRIFRHKSEQIEQAEKVLETCERADSAEGQKLVTVELEFTDSDVFASHQSTSLSGDITPTNNSSRRTLDYSAQISELDVITTETETPKFTKTRGKYLRKTKEQVSHLRALCKQNPTFFLD